MSHTSGDGRRQHPAGPQLASLHAAMLLSGFGTVFLGPVLPSLAAATHASDSGSGLFFTAQFAGAFLGGITTSGRLTRCLLRGLGGAAIGFAGLTASAASHASILWVLLALLALGFGVGQTLTSVNLLVARRTAAEGQTSALSLVNFTWSAGAVAAPFLLGTVLSAFGLTHVLIAVALVYACVFLAVFTGKRDEHSAEAAEASASCLPATAFAIFATMLLVYGGVETSLGGWITTFATRYASASLRSAAADTTALWLGITAGRALTPLLLRFVRDRVLLLASLTLASVVVVVLSRAGSTVTIAALAAVLGLAMAPWFPLVLSSMLRGGASPRQTGTIIAVSGIGAAVLPAVLGFVSGRTGSLRIALAVPVAGLVFLIVLASLPAARTSAKSV